MGVHVIKTFLIGDQLADSPGGSYNTRPNISPSTLPKSNTNSVHKLLAVGNLSWSLGIMQWVLSSHYISTWKCIYSLYCQTVGWRSGIV